MTEKVKPLSDAERKRALNKLKSLIHGTHGLAYKTDSSRAIGQLMGRLNLEFPITVVFFDKSENFFDRYRAGNQTEFIEILQRGPLTNLLSRRQYSLLKPERGKRKGDFEIDIESAS